jgi:hypothetical protein
MSCNPAPSHHHAAQRRPLRGPRAAAWLAALVFGSAAAATAGEWKWSVTPYVWGTDVGVDATLGDRRVVEETIPVTDLLEDLDAVAQVHLEAQRGAHGLMVDLFDVRLSEPFTRAAEPPQPGSDLLLASEIGMTILEVGGLYDPRGDQQGFGLLYGARALDQRVEIKARRVSTQEELPTHEARETLADALLGVRWSRRIGERWSVAARADASAGGTELTWSAGAAAAWAFGEERRYAVTAGYRRMVVDFARDGALDVDMTLSGFLAGVRAGF